MDWMWQEGVALPANCKFRAAVLHVIRQGPGSWKNKKQNRGWGSVPASHQAISCLDRLGDSMCVYNSFLVLARGS